MQTITLYRYIREGGGVTVSMVKPDVEYTTLSRLVAEDGYLLTDGVTVSPCVDTDTADIWSEIPDPEYQFTDPDKATEADYIAEFNRLGVEL